jgi:hypothetical protein
MDAWERASQTAKIIHGHYCGNSLEKLTETAIYIAVAAAIQEEREACARFIEEECKLELGLGKLTKRAPAEHALRQSLAQQLRARLERVKEKGE